MGWPNIPMITKLSAKAITLKQIQSIHTPDSALCNLSITSFMLISGGLILKINKLFMVLDTVAGYW